VEPASSQYPIAAGAPCAIGAEASKASRILMQIAYHEPKKKKQFFLEEKPQKTSALDAIPSVSTVVQVHAQKSFGSFLQKRTCLF
jgi:hypothetical protein